jgi:MFS family permease
MNNKPQDLAESARLDKQKQKPALPHYWPKSGIVLLFSGSLIFQTVQIGIYPILITQLMANNSVENSLIGVFLAVSWMAVLLCGPAVPGFIRKFGFARANQLATLLTISGFVCVVISSILPIIFISALFMGLGLIIRWIACDTLVVAMSDTGSRGKTIGLHEALMGLGIALGPLFFTLLELDKIAIAAIALSIAGQSALSMAGTGNAAYHDNSGVDARRNFPYRLIAAALAAAFVAGFIENAAISLFPLHFAGFGFTLSTSAVLVSAFGFGGTLLQPPLGYLSDRKGYAFAQNLCIAIIVLACLTAIIFSRNFVILYAALFFLGAAAGGLNTLAVIEAGITLKSSHIPAAMTAIAIFYTIGSIFGPIGAGVVLELLANRGMLVLFAASGLILAVVIGILHKNARRGFKPARES